MNNECYKIVLSEEYMDYIVDYQQLVTGTINYGLVCYNRISDYYASVHVPVTQLTEDVLNAYGYRVFPRLYGLLDCISIEKSGVNRLRNMSGLNLYGKGVLIGIVDTGLDYTHSAFLKEDGTSKVLSIWDQTIQGGRLPTNINYGTEYTKEEINEALKSEDPLSIVPSTDTNGHGTFLAGIAVGNLNKENDFCGVVPEADIVAVKLKPAKQNYRDFYLISQGAICYQENDIMLGIKYLLNMAEKYKRPISIIIGLGSSQGAHDSLGALENYLTSISQSDGVVVTAAAGNEGTSRHHFESLLGAKETSTTMEINVGKNEGGFTMEIWGDSPGTFSLDLLSPGGEYVPRIYPRIGEQRIVTFIFERTMIYVYFQIVGARAGAQLVILRFIQPSEGIWKINIYKGGVNLELHLNSWLPMSEFISKDTFFLKSQVFTTLTSPGTASIPITATAYDTTNDSLYRNASRGFNRIGRPTPSIAAPGINVIGPVPGNQYQRASGTSIAAAHTAGVAAMLLEWGKVRNRLRYMDGIDIKNVLIRGAYRSEGIVYPDESWGYGVLDIFGSFESLQGNVR